MQKKKGIAFLLLIVLVCALVTGCGKKAELEKNSTIVKYKGGKIKAETLYEDLRDKYGISVLIDMIDHNIFDKKYKTTDEETKYVDNQISQMKSQYGDNDETFLAAVKQYLGVVGTLDMSSTGVVEVWYSIDKDLRGKGYGEKVLAQVTPYLIENIKGLNDIELKINKNNKASKKVALRNGYILDDEDKELGIDIYHYFGKH